MFKKTTARIAAIAIAMTAAMTGLSSTASASSMTNNSQTVICRTAEHTVSSTAAMKAPVVNGSPSLQQEHKCKQEHRDRLKSARM